MKVAVCLPSKGRAHQLHAWLGDMLLQPLPPGVAELLVPVAVLPSDWDTSQVVRQLHEQWRETDVHVWQAPRGENTTAVEGWNAAHAALRGQAEWVVLGADDIRWHDGWLREGLAVARLTGATVIGFNDGHTNLRDYAPHYMVSRWFIDTHLGGCLVPPAYQSWWFDREVCQKAAALGLYAPAWNTWLEHRHPEWKTAQMDDTYTEAWPLHDEDMRLYLARAAAGFPVDMEATV